MASAAGRARTFLLTDIEAIVDPDLPPPPPKRGAKASAAAARALPAAPHWQVVCIGYCWMIYRPGMPLRLTEAQAAAGLEQRWTLDWGVTWGRPERDLLEEYVGFVAENDPTIVTYAGRSYDLPVIAARCHRHAIRWPWYYDESAGPRRSARYRFSDARHLDLCEVLSDHGAGKRAGLAAWSQVAGWAGKGNVDGSKVAKLVAAGKTEEVASYCLGDVGMTGAALLRHLYVSGWLDPADVELDAQARGAAALASYQSAAGQLLELARGDLRTAELAAGVNEEWFLLPGSSEPGVGDMADDVRPADAGEKERVA